MRTRTAVMTRPRNRVTRVFRVRPNANHAFIKEKDIQPVGEFVYGKLKDMKAHEMLEVIKQHKDHPIAKYIEWNRDKASYAYQVYQVRQIVRSIYVEVKVEGETAPVPVKCLINMVRSQSDRRKTFQPIETVLDDDYKREQVIKQAWDELRCWVERYEVYDGDLQPVIKAIKNYLPLITGEE